MDFQYPATQTAVQVANIKVQLDCSRQDIAKALSLRYRQFLARPDDPARLNVRLLVEPSTIQSDLWKSTPVYRDDKISFQGQGYSGWIGLKDGEGFLELHSAYPIEEIDYFLRIAYAWLSFKAGGMLFHAAGVRYLEWAFVFFGPSGAGKTTVAQLSADYEVMNDDLLMLQFQDGKWWATSTPFTNPTQVAPAPGTAPLVGLYRLVQDQAVFLETMPAAEAIAAVLSCVPLIAAVPAFAPELLSRCSSLVRAIPVYRLHFRKEASFWELLRQEMTSN
jgi:hypothetical protein